MKILLSKTQWEQIGQTAGWIEKQSSKWEELSWDLSNGIEVQVEIGIRNGKDEDGIFKNIKSSMELVGMLNNENVSDPELLQCIKTVIENMSPIYGGGPLNNPPKWMELEKYKTYRVLKPGAWINQSLNPPIERKIKRKDLDGHSYESSESVYWKKVNLPVGAKIRYIGNKCGSADTCNVPNFQWGEIEGEFDPSIIDGRRCQIEEGWLAEDSQK